MTISNNFSDFGKSFQDNLLKCIIFDREFSNRVQEILEINYFEFRHHQIIVKKIFEYKQKYNKNPSLSDIKSIIKTELKDLTDVLKEKINNFLEEEIKNFKIEEYPYVKDKTIDFCRKQKLYAAMEKSIDLLNNSSFDEVAKIINDSIRIGADNNVGYEYEKDFEERYKTVSRSPISTGWDEIDKITQGGLGKGELGVAIAPTSSGKSFILTHLGSEAIKQGKNVIHYTLELSDIHVGKRYDSCLTGIPINDLHLFKDKVYETIVSFSGSLLIKEYPTKSASTQTIRNHLEKIKQREKEIDIVIIDYADLLKPITSYKEKRDCLESIYEELRSIAQDYKCPVWSVSQTNRSGINAEIITMESISEAFSKCFVADFIFSLSRTAEDKMSNTGRIYIAKNRAGPDGFILPIFMDLSKAKIEIFKNSDKDKFISSDSFKSGEDKIKEKYKKYGTK